MPSGPLTQLPFQVLVTKPPTPGDYAFAAWLIRDHALAVLPAVSSLKALRHNAHPSGATKPMIGFGNPLLDGRDESFAALAAAARARTDCAQAPWTRLASASDAVQGIEPVRLQNGVASVVQIRRQLPLPQTAEMMCAVGQALHADPGDIELGANATERAVKDLSATGALARYRTVLFATHGALSGQISGTTEPGLILTPPAAASEEDDGYLSASEIAALKFDADWVILAACNTAAGGAANAEALSGLAQAFFLAGARSLLVSHWEVSVNPTVKLITTALGAIAKDKKLGRAEALRVAMLGMIDHGEDWEAHPAYWAPFVVVGEGGAGR